MYPIVDITCSNRDITQKAEVLEYKKDSLRVVIKDTDITINLRREGEVYVGNQAGPAFAAVTATTFQVPRIVT